MGNLAILDKFDSTELTALSQPEYSQSKTHYDEKHKIGWFFMDAYPRPCFTPELLSDITTYQNNIKTEMASDHSKKYDYLVLASDVENVFNLGGDLSLFSQLIEQKNHRELFSYAKQCIDVLHQNMIHLNSELTTISLVQGNALGGGFEAALSSNVLIAERGSKLGLPEVLFNLFPGMGAFSLLSRKVGSVMAEKIILSGQLYSAEELFEMGVVDILAEKGEGELALYQYIKKANRSANSYQAIRKVKDICNQISYKELLDIAKIWTDAAFNLTDKDLRMMKKLVARQSSNSGS